MARWYHIEDTMFWLFLDDYNNCRPIHLYDRDINSIQQLGYKLAITN